MLHLLLLPIAPLVLPSALMAVLRRHSIATFYDADALVFVRVVPREINVVLS